MGKQNYRSTATTGPSATKRSQSFLTLRTLALILPLAIPVALLSRYLSSYGQLGIKEGYTPETCETHKYTTEIISLDPLVIYINNFTSAQEAEDLIAAAEHHFTPSYISRTSSGKNTHVSQRTSQSAPLPLSSTLVQCLLSRARAFMGTMLLPSETFSIPQLVRYRPGEHYDLHTDYWPQHQVLPDTSHGRDGMEGGKLLYNRPASFFVFLRDNCTGGETYFPLVDVFDDENDSVGKETGRANEVLEGLKGKVERGEKDGVKMGVKFKPIRGNAVFWVNLNKDGVGDRRVVHAGLKVGEGEKVGLNIWPRKIYGRVEGS